MKQDLYGKDDSTTDEKYVPSKLQKAASRHRMPFAPSSNKSSNAKTVIQCEDCLKCRVCYSSHVLKPPQRRELESELDNLSFSYGSCFQDIDGYEGGIFERVYVNDKLTCASPIEFPYYVTFSDPLCFHCGSEHDLTSTPQTYPLCEKCKDQGKVAKEKNIRAFIPR
ncbi:hypothetical protein BSL78_29001 [Apostichopus japonicus]|uniref:Uncharacterized protein n=1 Tax=Stichopus japonicus TaxID=307972 RepID=A0A2G8JEK7_STIJA|nr:hypothetical protein BSL78_29001 [Apostichopus japonicus]